MECPECAHVEDDSAFQEDQDDDYVCPECNHFWTE